MAKCNYFGKTNKKTCIGSMSKKIDILTRSITSATLNQNYDHNFDVLYSPYSYIESISGKDIFDGSNMIGTATHRIRIRKHPTYEVTSENFIRYKDVNYNILLVQNYNEDNEFIEIMACVRGDKDIRVNSK